MQNLLLLDHANIGTAQFDFSHRCLEINQTWQRLLSRSGCEPTASHLFDQLPDTQAILLPLIQAISEGETVQRSELRLRVNNQPTHWTVTCAAADAGYYLLLDDETDRVRQERRLERRIEDRTRKLTTLYDVMAAAGEAQDLRTTLEWALQRTLEAVRCEVGLIYLIDDFEEDAPLTYFRLVVTHNVDEATVVQQIDAQEPLVQAILSAETPTIITHLNQNALTAELFPPFGTATYLGMLMQSRGRIVGILNVFASTGQTFSAVEIALLDSVADQMGVIVENGYLHQQAEQVAILEERNRLARDLHDSVSQSLYSLNLFAEAGLRLIDSKNREKLRQCLRQLHDTSLESLRQMRLLVYELRPETLEEEGLVGALQHRLDAVEGRANVNANLYVEGDIETLPDEVEDHLYRIAQEALNNALKHASASLLTVRIHAEADQVELIIEDDGKGFDVDEAEQSGGIGLESMEERAEEIEGELFVESAENQGTTIRVVVDLDEYEESDDIF